MKKITAVALAIIPALLLAGCDDSARTEQSKIANQAAERAMANTATNAEIDNIEDRLKLTSNPNLLGHVALVNRVGQVVLYTTIKGKITSGSKRLTNPTACNMQGDCPSDEGTFGSSNPYIFFRTTEGAYVQTSMDYIYSDKPLRLEEKPMMVVETPAKK